MPSKRDKVQLSIISPTGYHGSTCGYCTAPSSGIRSTAKSSKSYGIWAHRLSPYHYQTLIDQGWRRSGDYIYKPDLARTCCAQIPVRLKADQFKPTKGHKRALTNLLFRVRQSKPKPAKWKGRWSRGRDWNVEERWHEIVASAESGHSAAAASSSSASSPSLAWAERVAGPITHKLEVKLALSSCTDEKHRLFRKYQAKVHGESEEKIGDEKSFRRFLVDTSMALTWPSTGLPLTSSEETQWRAKSWDMASLDHEVPYGCYHQEYRLDGKLIAVGVLDILPKCVSSVYLFYDPDFHDWQPGKVSALQEIALTERLGRINAMDDIAFYYMGFYIHTCQKMKYKAEYRPSQLLDCSSNSWRMLSEVSASLDAKQFFDWSEAQTPLPQGETKETNEAEIETASEADEQDDEEDERAVRVPTQPRPPPGMLAAQAILRALEERLRGIDSSDDDVELDLLQEAMVLEAKNQSAGIKPLLVSREPGLRYAT